ncbi:hypothetical protein JXD20_01290 [Candidatus Peregrinibacteria bacterium]|nr:hypothetical protein [Candidatus Peregrinibacteria bacterium]
MPLRPSENTNSAPDFARRIAGILGISLIMAGCQTEKTEEADIGKRCHTIVENNRTRIFCFLGEQKPARPFRNVSQEESKHAEARNGERTEKEALTLYDQGGRLFNMRRIPEMSEESPVVMAKGENGSPTKVYIRLPQDTNDKNTPLTENLKPRMIIFYHGNGGQEMRGSDTTNVIEFTKEMQETGDPIILMAPQDGWANFQPEGREKDEPGNWRDFNDPDTFANLVAFAEGLYGKQAESITLASFSGGNIGVMKTLRALETVKKEQPEMADLYKKIQRIAYFDSATGRGSQYVANWMTVNPEASVWNCYNGGNVYNKGAKILLETLQEQDINPDNIHSEKMKYGYSGHGIFRQYYHRFVADRQN